MQSIENAEMRRHFSNNEASICNPWISVIEENRFSRAVFFSSYTHICRSFTVNQRRFVFGGFPTLKVHFVHVDYACIHASRCIWCVYVLKLSPSKVRTCVCIYADSVRPFTSHVSACTSTYYLLLTSAEQSNSLSRLYSN